MKISKERLMEIIKEELDAGAFGSDTVSKSSRVADLRAKAKDTTSASGVDAKERGIIQRIEKNLTKLAELSNIRSGNTFSLLKRINALMEKEIAKLEDGEQTDEQ